MTHFSELMVAIYIDLERLIKETPLTKKQRVTVKYLMEGYNTQDLSELWNVSRQSIDDQLRKACVKLAKVNSDKHWEILEKKYHNRMVG